VSPGEAEAVHFGPIEGQRGFIYVTDLPDGSRIASVVEPWWLRLGADVTLAPVFNREEMQKAAPSIAATVAKYQTAASFPLQPTPGVRAG
jgi:hypothetical protein